MTDPRSATRAWAPVFAGLCVVLVLTFTAFGAVIPVIPRRVLDDLGAAPFWVGAAFGTSGLVAIVARPYAGRLAQRLGSRPVMVAGCLLAAAVGASYALPLGLAGLLGTRVVMGLAESMVFTAGSLWTVGLAPADRRGQVVGWYGLAMWTGWTFGPLVGEVTFRAGGEGPVWTVAAVAPLVAAAVVSRLPGFASTAGPASRRLLPRAAVLPGISLALASAGYATLVGFGALLLGDRDIGGGGLLLTVFGGAYIVVRLVAGRLPDRVGAAPVAVWCGALEASGLVLLVVAPAFWVAGVGALLMGAGFTLLYPALALLVIDGSAEDERGAALGAYTSFWDLGLGAAGLVAGALAGLSYAAPFVLSAVAAALCAATGAVAARRIGTHAPAR